MEAKHTLSVNGPHIEIETCHDGHIRYSTLAIMNEAMQPESEEWAHKLVKAYNAYESDQEQIKALRDALERLKSGAAIYIGGVIPNEFRDEHRARMRFIELVLSGVLPKDAEIQACAEQVAICKAALAATKSLEQGAKNDEEENPHY